MALLDLIRKRRSIRRFLFHLLLFAIVFPSPRRDLIVIEKQPRMVIRRFRPAKPQHREMLPRKKLRKPRARKLPVPDPTPDEPEPIREPEPEIIDTPPLPPDMKFLIGVPEAPPPQGPLLAGVGDVTNPIPIEESKVQPDYPELGRQFH